MYYIDTRKCGIETEKNRLKKKKKKEFLERTFKIAEE